MGTHGSEMTATGDKGDSTVSVLLNAAGSFVAMVVPPAGEAAQAAQRGRRSTADSR